MKGILEFDLDEEAHEFKIACHAMDYRIAIDDTWNVIRKYRKYIEITDEQSVLLEKIAGEIVEVTKDLPDL